MSAGIKQKRSHPHPGPGLNHPRPVDGFFTSQSINKSGLFFRIFNPYGQIDEQIPLICSLSQPFVNGGISASMKSGQPQNGFSHEAVYSIRLYNLYCLSGGVIEEL